eukprot:COSAG01_NODE_5887_length_3969_cov_4.471576_4_plen_84_part_00
MMVLSDSSIPDADRGADDPPVVVEVPLAPVAIPHFRLADSDISGAAITSTCDTIVFVTRLRLGTNCVMNHKKVATVGGKFAVA